MSIHANMPIQSAHPMHILLVADNSLSMQGPPAKDATDGARRWIYELQQPTRGKKPYFKFSFILFGSSADVIASALDVNEIDPATVVIDGSGGSTNMAAALVEAQGAIVKAAAPHHCPPFVFLFTDGHPDDPKAAREAAIELKSTDLPCGSPRLVTLGFGSVNDDLLSQIATSPEFYKRLPDSQALLRLLPAIGTPTLRAGGTVGSFERQIKETTIRETII